MAFYTSELLKGVDQAACIAYCMPSKFDSLPTAANPFKKGSFPTWRADPAEIHKKRGLFLQTAGSSRKMPNPGAMRNRRTRSRKFPAFDQKVPTQCTPSVSPGGNSFRCFTNSDIPSERAPLTNYACRPSTKGRLWPHGGDVVLSMIPMRL